MNKKQLEQNMIDMIKEQQIKLGYRSETVRLYYPASSIKNLLEIDCSDAELPDHLRTFCNSVKQTLGNVSFDNRGDRFCFVIPPQGADYVHEHLDEQEFIVTFIHAIRDHSPLDKLFAIFHEYSDHVHIEEMTNCEFHYLIYFEDGIPDNYRYCLTLEGSHITYHRFTLHDYLDFDF